MAPEKKPLIQRAKQLNGASWKSSVIQLGHEWSFERENIQLKDNPKLAWSSQIILGHHPYSLCVVLSDFKFEDE